MEIEDALSVRARRYAALGEPARLAIVDVLTWSDRSPQELQRALEVPSNLLAHHLDVLERVGLISRGRSSGDGRRRYVHLNLEIVDALDGGRGRDATSALFVCTANSARSQLAAALWTQVVGHPAASAGTHPADRVHPGAVAAGRRAGVDLRGATPALLDGRDVDGLVITVCDRAHEELGPDDGWLHWSIPDPVAVNTPAAFDATVTELRARIGRFAA